MVIKYNFTFLAGSSLLAISNCSSNSSNHESLTPAKFSFPSPNVIIILLDDVGFNKLGAYSGNNLTPNIDALAADGVVYDSVYVSSAVCTPSRYSLFTGNFAGRCTHERFLRENPVDQPYRINWNTYLTENDNTLFETMRENGYHTGFVGKWHLTHPNDLSKILPDFDLNLIPDSAESFLIRHQEILAEYIKKISGADIVENVIAENNENNPLKELQCHHTEWMTLGLCNFIDESPDNKPFFAFLGTPLTHGPSALMSLKKNPVYTPEGRINEVMKYHPDRQSVLNRFKNKVSEWDEGKLGAIWLDDQGGAVVKKLKEKGAYDNTIIIIVSDNNNEPGKAGCYESGTHVPMIIKWQNNKSKGTHSGQAIQTIDIFPTVIEECGIELKDRKVDGISFAKNKKPDRKDLYFEMGITRALKYGKYKYIAFKMPENEIEKMKTGKISEAPNQMNVWWAAQTYVAMKAYPAYWDQDQLYDIVNDPFELHNLASDTAYSKVLIEMKSRLAIYLGSFIHPYSLDFQEFMVSDEFNILKKEAQKKIPEMVNKLEMFNFKWPPVKK